MKLLFNKLFAPDKRIFVCVNTQEIVSWRNPSQINGFFSEVKTICPVTLMILKV